MAKADVLLEKTLSCPPIKLSNLQTVVLDAVATEVLLSNFAQHLRRENAELPDISLTQLDAAGTSPNLVLNHNARAKRIGSWVAFKYCTSEAAIWCCLWVCEQLGGN